MPGTATPEVTPRATTRRHAASRSARAVPNSLSTRRLESLRSLCWGEAEEVRHRRAKREEGIAAVASATQQEEARASAEAEGGQCRPEAGAARTWSRGHTQP